LGVPFGSLAILKTPTLHGSYDVVFVPYFRPPRPPGSITLTSVDELWSMLATTGVGNVEARTAVDHATRYGVAFLRDVVVTRACRHRDRLVREDARPVGDGLLPSVDGMKILVVDDDTAVLQTMIDGLTFKGAAVLGADSAEMALATLVEARPQVLLSDIAMPDRNGLWLIRQVRELPESQGGRTPAAAITGHVLDNDRVAALDAGFQCVLQKPVALDDLVETVSLLTAKPIAPTPKPPH
jgi:CheY-like chemotaxis protein